MKWIKKIISLVGSLVPTTNIILFHSFPDYSDNSYAFCRFIHKKGIDASYDIIWLIDDPTRKSVIKKMMAEEGIVASLISRKSIKGIWFYIRARYVFVTHGCFDGLDLHQHNDKVINLWHGMPLKLLGASEKNGIPGSTNFNYLISSSELYQNILAEAFSCDKDKILVTGQPRCDLLFEKTDWFEKVGVDIKKYKAIGIWMPTYRKAIVGDIRIDGSYKGKNVSFLSEKELTCLDSFLQNNNILIFIKIHPMDALQNETFEDYQNIYFIKPKDFNSQLYPLLGACDFLLTDYSSVFIDYQILNKPIGFVMNDVDSYKGSRGFYFNDLEEALPGPILTDYNSLCGFILKPYVATCRIKYNDFYDSNSSERIANFLNLNI